MSTYNSTYQRMSHEICYRENYCGRCLYKTDFLVGQYLKDKDNIMIRYCIDQRKCRERVEMLNEKNKFNKISKNNINSNSCIDIIMSIFIH